MKLRNLPSCAIRHSVGAALSGLLLATALTILPGKASAIETAGRQAIVVDFNTGAVLFDKNADEPMYPASMSKLMTIYLVLERLKAGELSLDDTFLVSEKAWRKGGSKMFVEVNTRASVKDLLRGIIVQSGNDACIVIAEGLAGTEANFVELMNEKARELGLENSHFTNATGWPDPEHQMSARDLAILSKHLIENFPDHYAIFSEREFTYSDITQGNRNPLLYRNIGVDGLKTGHTEISGYGLTASAERNGRRVIVVVHGLDGMQSRADESARLVEWAFREFDNYTLVKAGEPIAEAPVWLGEGATVPFVVNTDLVATLPRHDHDDIQVVARFDGPIPAPIEPGQEIGTLVISAPGLEPVETPVFAGAAVDRLGPVGRIAAAVKYLLLPGDGSDDVAADATSESASATN
ncbi:D-alanyl-D-alanine carboxypeptidase family protein [Rhodospirillaceae bacterium SYSU D60014]|uniref:D-alanyl-D-alanine carboxypeptidase family protein n=1 Tax=Virgifigura deserti TaxID=2268457 RepID=UPI000E667CE4